jgi:hypothetical protein
MSTLLIFIRDSIKHEKSAEKSIFIQCRVKEAENAENTENAENRAECPPNDLQKELILV